MKSTIIPMIVALAALPACSGDDDKPKSVGVGSANYAVNASAPNAQGGEDSYVALVGSLDKSVEIDYGKALPILGGSGIFGPDEGGYFLVGRDAEPTIQRYEVTEDGKFIEGDKFSVEEAGITSAWAGSNWGTVYSDDKAYFVNPFGLNVVEFNPTDMTLTQVIDNPELILEDDPDAKLWSQGHGTPQRVGDKIYIPAMYRNNDTDTAYPHTAVAVLDMKTDKVTYTKDDRCGPTITTSLGPDGNLYLSSWLWRYGPVGRPAEPAACLLRVDTETGEIDPDFYVETKKTLGGGHEIASVIFGDDGKPYSVVFHEDAYEITDKTQSWEPANAPAWGWIALDPNFEEPGTEIPGKLQGGHISTFIVDGSTLVNVETEDTATLFSITADGLEEKLTLNGRAWGVVKLR